MSFSTIRSSRLKGGKAEKGALLPILPPRFIHSIRIGTNETLVSDGILGNTAGFLIEIPAKSMFPSAAIPRVPRNVHDPPGLVVASLLHIRSLKLLYAADREWRGTILVGYFTGARLGNLARLKWKNLDLVERSLTFVQDKTDPKSKSRFISISWNISNR